MLLAVQISVGNLHSTSVNQEEGSSSVTRAILENYSQTRQQGMTPSRDGYSYGATSTLLRDELRIIREMVGELRGQAEIMENIQSRLRGLPQPTDEYRIRPTPVEIEEEEVKVEEEMSDRMARQRVEE